MLDDLNAVTTCLDQVSLQTISDEDSKTVEDRLQVGLYARLRTISALFPHWLENRKTVLNRESRLDRPCYSVTTPIRAGHWTWSWPMTFIFNRKRAIFLIYTHTLVPVQGSVGSKDKRADRCTLPMALPTRLTRSENISLTNNLPVALHLSTTYYGKGNKYFRCICDFRCSILLGK